MTWRAATPILCAILLACTAAAFLPARNFAFVGWDDSDEVTENPLLHPPTMDHLGQIWSGPYLNLYAPLTYTVWWTLARMGAGDNPYAFHLLNVLLHLACAGLVFSILRLCVKSPAAAFGGAVVFALHPMQAESVGWIAEMNNLLAAAMSLAAIRLYLASGATAARRRWIIYALGSAAYLAALFCKPTAVVAPLIAVILDAGALRRPLRPAVYALAPWLAAAGAFAWIAHRSQGGITVPIVDRPMVALDALGFYCRKILWPAGLTIDYARTPGRVLFDHAWVAGAGIAVGLGVVLWLLRRKCRGAALGALIALAALLPVLGLVPFTFQEWSTVADRFVYLAMLGPALAVGTLLAGLRQRAALPAAAAAGLILAWPCTDQLQLWRDNKTLVSRTLALDPGSAVGNLLAGSELTRQGHPELAITYFFASLARDPNNPYVQTNLANALASVGKNDQAIEHFRTAIALFDPRDPLVCRAMNNLGIAYAKIGRRDLAVSQFKRVLELDPHNPQAIQNLQILGERVPSR
ncbi:MAG: tetratricopeptide repeat protein [Tepidisphaeraceae bacterium]|jgi:tetratricopeptide (TPR) repeat protein